MTKKIILSLAAMILLSACAGKFGLQKRRYTKGFYVSVTKKNGDLNKHESEKTKHAATKNATAANQVASHVITALAAKAPVVSTAFINTASVIKAATAEKTRQPAARAPQKPLTAAAKKEIASQAIGFKALSLKAKSMVQVKGNGGDVNSIVLIILCIILPPLAVFLFDQKLSGNFWLDLILTLLFYLPGMIYAFLVCFAGVSI